MFQDSLLEIPEQLCRRSCDSALTNQSQPPSRNQPSKEPRSTPLSNHPSIHPSSSNPHSTQPSVLVTARTPTTSFTPVDNRRTCLILHPVRRSRPARSHCYPQPHKGVFVRDDRLLRIDFRWFSRDRIRRNESVSQHLATIKRIRSLTPITPRSTPHPPLLASLYLHNSTPHSRTSNQNSKHSNSKTSNETVRKRDRRRHGELPLRFGRGGGEKWVMRRFVELINCLFVS